MSELRSIEDAYVEAHDAWEQATDFIPAVAAAWAVALLELADDVESFASSTLSQLPGIQRRLRQVIEQNAPAIEKARTLVSEETGKEPE